MAVASAQTVGLVLILGAQLGIVLATLALSRGGSAGNPVVTFWIPDWSFPEFGTESVHFQVAMDRHGTVTAVSGIETGGIGP
jgi:hypothetical protein